jgi:hypothetical protein
MVEGCEHGWRGTATVISRRLFLTAVALSVRFGKGWEGG